MGVNYHKIFFSKPSYDYIIDDKSIYAKKILKNGIQNKLKNILNNLSVPSKKFN